MEALGLLRSTIKDWDKQSSNESLINNPGSVP
jgi:hypothetical protein